MTPLTEDSSPEKIVNAFTVDVEDYFHVSALAAAIPRERWGSLECRVERNMKRLLDLLEMHEVRATFFVLAWVADRYSSLIKAIHERGHEVGCHGKDHKLIYNQTPDEFRRETEEAKKLLEDTIGSSVLGYRAASYSITKASEWALDIIAEAGFTYDSSIVPVRHDLYGMPGSDSLPHKLLTSRGSEIIEFPPTTYRIFGVNFPVGGGGYFRLYPYPLTRHLLTRINEAQRRPFIFYIHPWEIDPDQPRVKTSLLSSFRHYLNLGKCEARLTKLLTDFAFTNAATVLRSLPLSAG